MVKLVVRASLAAPRDALTSSIFEDAESTAWVMGDQLQISVMIFLYHVFFVLKNMYLFIYLCIYIYIISVSSLKTCWYYLVLLDVRGCFISCNGD